MDRGLSQVVTPPPAASAPPPPERSPASAERSRRSLVRLALVSSDLFSLTISIGIVWLVIDDTRQLLPLLMIIPVWALLSGFYGLYYRDRVGADNATLDEIWPIFHCVTVASWLVFVVTQITSLPQPARRPHGGLLGSHR